MSKIKTIVCSLYVFFFVITVGLKIYVYQKDHPNPFKYCDYFKGWRSTVTDRELIAGNWQNVVYCRYKNKNLYYAYDKSKNEKDFYVKRNSLRYLFQCGKKCDLKTQKCEIGICDIADCPSGYSEIYMLPIEKEAAIGVCYNQKVKKSYPAKYYIDDVAKYNRIFPNK